MSACLAIASISWDLSFRSRFVHQRRRLTLQSEAQHLLDPAHRVNLEPVLDLVRDLDQILDVLFGDQHLADAAASGCKELFLQPADRQHFAA